MSKVADFIARWEASAASERANSQSFLCDLCDLLGVPRPDPAVNDPARDRYVFEKAVPTPVEGGLLSRKSIDLYKERCFILEAKQGGHETGKAGTARRGTQGWYTAMQSAQGQALGYAKSLEPPPPFLLIVDIGYCFELYASFDGTTNYHHYPTPQKSRFFLKDLDDAHLRTLRAVFEDPLSLDPARHAARITREVAGHIADLARALEKDRHHPELVAQFLMRCLFTMFAEDVDLLPDHAFTKMIQTSWIADPRRFPRDIEALWSAMNTGSYLPLFGEVIRFNGGLFASPTALPLSVEQLRLLEAAAVCDWSNVDPSIFGTLLERALSKDERHKLGAHYTPRAYVERLVRPTIEEPVRAEWEIVRAEVQQLRTADKVDAAKKAVHAFHKRLCSIRVLDPACGTGNFLYVTLDVFKRIESEVFRLLEELGESQQRLELHYDETVTPRQFLGIEIKPWAKEIAELVLWIGYLQWHFRMFGKVSPPIPVLRDHKNIECRDAVLACDSIEMVRDEKTGQPITRWDGKSMKQHPVTGEDVPDESVTVHVERYVNPRKAEWPEAEFIVGNPPFIGIARMRSLLGEGYAEALRATYQDLPDSIDFVMYWWDCAAEQLTGGKLRRFGLITTNSITQSFNRRVLKAHLEGTPKLSLVFAIPDHPWVESSDGAAVRIAMTSCGLGTTPGVLGISIRESRGDSDDRRVTLEWSHGTIHSDLRIGVNVTSAATLRANSAISSRGVQLMGSGFILTRDEAASLGLGKDPLLASVIRPYLNGRDIAAKSRGALVVDLFDRSELEVRTKFPSLYQWLFDRVKPERDQNNRAAYRTAWWIFGEPRQTYRPALSGLGRQICTVETSKHRFFVFLDGSILPDNKLISIAINDAYILGALSSRVHQTWASSTGGLLEDRPVYVKSACFEKFPFPVCTEEQQARIRALGEQLDAHRKRQQAQHPDLTITGMYNVLEKLRSGEALNDKDRRIHEQGLVTLLKQIHEELDAAVFDAYGWPRDLSDEQILERLVALNAERAEEEKKGFVRWLRPDFQNPSGKKEMAQVGLPGQALAAAGDDETPAVTAAAWPKKTSQQIAAVRDLFQKSSSLWTERQVQAAFEGARKKEVAAALESLAALGIVIAYDGAGGVQYRAAARAAA